MKKVLLISVLLVCVSLNFGVVFGQSDYNPDLTPTPYGIQNPSGTIPAGTPIIVGDYEMVIDDKNVTYEDGIMGFDIFITNTSPSKNKLFRFNAAAMKLTDDMGNVYEPLIGRNKCIEADLYKPKQIMLKPNEKKQIYLAGGIQWTSYSWWCLEGHPDYIPGYSAGQIPLNVNSMYLEFDGFGPFSGFRYEFEL